MKVIQEEIKYLLEMVYTSEQEDGLDDLFRILVTLHFYCNHDKSFFPCLNLLPHLD